MTTKPEHDTHEQPTAANYTAGDSFAKISADCRKIAADIASAGIDGFGNQVQTIIERIEALAAIPAGELPPLPPPSVPAIQRGYPGMKPSYTQPDYYTAEQIRERDAMWQSRLDALTASHRERGAKPADKPAGQAVTHQMVLAAVAAVPSRGGPHPTLHYQEVQAILEAALAASPADPILSQSSGSVSNGSPADPLPASEVSP